MGNQKEDSFHKHLWLGDLPHLFFGRVQPNRSYAHHSFVKGGTTPYPSIPSQRPSHRLVHHILSLRLRNNGNVHSFATSNISTKAWKWKGTAELKVQLTFSKEFCEVLFIFITCRIVIDRLPTKNDYTVTLNFEDFILQLPIL